jgi:hypothetical protein
VQRSIFLCDSPRSIRWNFYFSPTLFEVYLGMIDLIESLVPTMLLPASRNWSCLAGEKSSYLCKRLFWKLDVW